MYKISDFSNLDEEHKTALLKLLKKYPDKTLFSKGELEDVDLHFRIIKHLSSATPRFGKKRRRIRYEVLDNSKCGEGAAGNCYKSLFTLSIDAKDQLQIKKRKSGSLRLVKEQYFFSNSNTKLKRIKRECRYLQKCSFFHAKPLVKLNNTSFIVMRDVEANDLFEIMQSTFTIKQRYNLTMSLLKALQEQIHSKGLVHKDIKPENILVKPVGDDFTAYIIDYGTIKTQKYNDSKDPAGTSYYAPPEFFLLNTNANQKYDIYCMGRVLMYIWGGYDSEDRDNDFASYATAATPEIDHLFAKMDEMPECHKEIKNLIEQMCLEFRYMRPDIKQVLDGFKSLENSLQVCKKTPTTPEEDQSDLSPV